MDYPIHIDTISIELSILHLKGLPVKFLYNDVFLSLMIVFILAKSAEPEMIRHFICVFAVSIQNTKG